MEPYACSEDLEHWRSSWSFSKATWCCKHHAKGCPDTPTTTPAPAYDCNTGLSRYWPERKANWCCEHHLQGCHTTTRELYSCSADLESESRWPHDQKAWCCLHHSRGCFSASTALAANRHRHDCLASLTTWEQTWPKAKKKWCCDQEQLGCEETTTSPPYDCKAGGSRRAPENWETAWSDGRQAWCCLYEHVGCPADVGGGATTTMPLPYDCEAGLFNSENLWPPAKKEWCCIYGNNLVRSTLHESFGCPDPLQQSLQGQDFSQETFQRKFMQWPAEFMRRLERMYGVMVPTFYASLTFLAVAGVVRSCSRGSWVRTAEDILYGSSRVFRPLDLEADGPEREQLLELPGRMESEDWLVPQRC